MIHPTKKKGWFWNSAKDSVLKGRNHAGREMLKIVFDLLTSWNEQNVENFFVLLQQFFKTYCDPVLHDGREKPWGLSYGRKEVIVKV